MPSTDASQTITVDQSGNLCPGSGISTVPTIPTSTAPAVPTLTDSTTTAPTTPSTGTGTGVSAQEWPAGKAGWTIILAGYPKSRYERSDAEQRAAQAQADGLSSGVLDSSDYSSLNPRIWVVFSGVYDTSAQAEAGLAKANAAGYQGAYAREIRE